jgi:NUMOD3 motif
MNQLNKIVNNFYIYQHLKADTNEIFYVGKGNKKRAYSYNRGDYWKRVVAKHGLIVQIIYQDLDEETAFKLEIETIQQYRSQGIKLVNMTDGGEGTSGRITTDESRINYSKSRLGSKNPMYRKTHNPEIIEKIRQALNCCQFRSTI